MTLKAALDAWQRGFHLFPVQPMEKTPHLDRGYPIHWSELATRNIATVYRWWEMSPTANVGIPAKQSGLLILDCDLPKDGTGRQATKGTPYAKLMDRFDGYVDGFDILRELTERCGGDFKELIDTFTVCTGSGGCQLYFKWPVNVKASQSSLLLGLLDIRCNGGSMGGYVLGAGSRTSKGEYTVEVDRPIRDCPAWLVERCRQRDPLPRLPAGPFAQPGMTGNFAGLVDSVKYATEGNRSNVTFWAARSMCADGAPLEKAEDLLIPAAALAGLHESEARATVRSGYNAQQRKG